MPSPPIASHESISVGSTSAGPIVGACSVANALFGFSSRGSAAATNIAPVPARNSRRSQGRGHLAAAWIAATIR